MPALVVYGIAAFAVLQITQPVMRGLHWPDTVLLYVVGALAVGFPIVAVLAWRFDVYAGRPKGAKLTVSAGNALGLRGARFALLLVGIGLLAAVPGLSWYFFFRSDTRIVARRGPESAGAAERKSIAVLPFVPSRVVAAAWVVMGAMIAFLIAAPYTLLDLPNGSQLSSSTWLTATTSGRMFTSGS